MISKVFFTVVYIICGTSFINIAYNNSFTLIHNGNGGFVGRIINENIYKFTNFIENPYVVYSLIVLTLIFFILSLGLKLNEIIKILYLPYFLIKKIISFFQTKKDKNKNIENEAIYEEPNNLEETSSVTKQPILPFNIKK